ncbi:DUF3604 domain-containing protein [Myxococcota bacterium]|nr:DUF3604 domain-containing protein [Myxococcota bacterium]
MASPRAWVPVLVLGGAAACTGVLMLDGPPPPAGGLGVGAVLSLDDGGYVDAEFPTSVEVGSAHVFRFRVIAGAGGIDAGAKVRLRVPGTFARPQRGEGGTEGWVTARSDEEEAIDVLTWVAEAGDHLTGTEGWYVDGTLGEAVASGQAVEVVYGDTSGGSFGARVSFLARPAFPFEVSLDDDGDGTFDRVETFTVETLAGEPVELRVAAQSTVVQGMGALVQAAAFDLLGNPADGVGGSISCEWTAGEAVEPGGTVTLAGGDLHGEIGQATFTAPAEPGPWRLACSHDALPVTVLGATIVQPLGAEYLMGGGAGGGSVLLWGDLHIHSSVSGDAGTASLDPDDIYDRAQNNAMLRFAAISDHDRGGIDAGSWISDAVVPANDAHDDGTFVTLLGWEWTDSPSATEGGHKIVYYVQGDGSSYCTATGTDCPTGATEPVAYFSNLSTDYDSSCELWEALALQMDDEDVGVEAITVPHHVATTGTPPFTAWDTLPDDCSGGPPYVGRGLQPLVELYSDHGSAEGWNGATPAPIEDPVECTPDLDLTVQEALEYQLGSSSDEAHYLGIVASGDSHFGRPGQDPLPLVDEVNNNGGTAGVGIRCPGGPGEDPIFRWREVGLAAVWVEAASLAAATDRAEVFESLKRRRTYGTTGSRITLSYYLTDNTGGADTVIDQGGAPPSGATDYDDPEYAIVGAASHTTTLHFTDICPGTGSLDTVRLFHGYDNAGTWTWALRKTWSSADFTGGCLLSKTVPLIVGGTVNGTNLKEGKNVYYVKVKEADTKPIIVGTGRNTLRLTPDGGSPTPCELTSGSWLPAVYASSGDLEGDLESCLPTLDFAVSYNAGAPTDPNRLVISADTAFAMDGDFSANVKATMAMLGFAQVDQASATSHTSDDQVQPAVNAEFAWSSPIWIDYVEP